MIIQFSHLPWHKPLHGRPLSLPSIPVARATKPISVNNIDDDNIDLSPPTASPMQQALSELGIGLNTGWRGFKHPNKNKAKDTVRQDPREAFPHHYSEEFGDPTPPYND